MIAQHAHGRYLRRREVAREIARFLRKPVVREVAAEHEHIGALGDLGEERLERAQLGALGTVQVRDGGAEVTQLPAHVSHGQARREPPRSAGDVT